MPLLTILTVRHDLASPFGCLMNASQLLAQPAVHLENNHPDEPHHIQGQHNLHHLTLFEVEQRVQEILKEYAIVSPDELFALSLSGMLAAYEFERSVTLKRTNG